MFARNSADGRFSVKYPQERIDYASVEAAGSGLDLSELNRELVIDLFKSFGAVLFRGFSVDLSSFTKFSDLFMCQAVRNRATGRELIDEASRTQTVNLGREPFPLHPELSQTALRPEICWFYCVKSPIANGETTICDGIRIARGLKLESRALLERKKLRYVCGLSPKEFQILIEGSYSNWQEALNDKRIAAIFKLKPGTRFVPQLLFATKIGRAIAGALGLTPDRIVQDSILPCLYNPKFSDGAAFGNFILFSRYLHGRRDYPTFEDGEQIPEPLINEIKKLSDSLTCSIRWQSGDMLMLDNTRFMHGRNKVDDVRQRIIYTRFGMVNFE